MVFPASPPGRRSRLIPAAGAEEAAPSRTRRGVAPADGIDRCPAADPEDDRATGRGKATAVGRVGDRRVDARVVGDEEMPAWLQEQGRGPGSLASHRSASRDHVGDLQTGQVDGRRPVLPISANSSEAEAPPVWISVTRRAGGQPTAASMTAAARSPGATAPSAAVAATRIVNSAAAAARERVPPGNLRRASTRRAERHSGFSRWRSPGGHRRQTPGSSDDHVGMIGRSPRTDRPLTRGSPADHPRITPHLPPCRRSRRDRKEELRAASRRPSPDPRTMASQRGVETISDADHMQRP